MKKLTEKTKKLHKKIRRHPKPDKLLYTCIVGALLLLGAYLILTL